MIRQFVRVDQLFVPLYRALPAALRARAWQWYLRVLTLSVAELPPPALLADQCSATRQVSIIVPVCNAPEWTARCFRSLERYAGGAEVIVVDDGSTDADTLAIIAEFADRCGWAVVRNPVPGGHSGACMTGAAVASREVFCFLNSDTVVTRHLWLPCLEALRREPRLMLVGPRTSAGLPEQTDRLAAYCRGRWSDQRIFGFAEQNMRRYGGRPPRMVPAISGVALFVRRADWARLDGFAGCRPHYGNDLDLCDKVRALGGLIGIADAAYLHHFKARSASADDNGRWVARGSAGED